MEERHDRQLDCGPLPKLIRNLERQVTSITALQKKISEHQVTDFQDIRDLIQMSNETLVKLLGADLKPVIAKSLVTVACNTEEVKFISSGMPAVPELAANPVLIPAELMMPVAPDATLSAVENELDMSLPEEMSNRARKGRPKRISTASSASNSRGRSGLVSETETLTNQRRRNRERDSSDGSRSRASKRSRTVEEEMVLEEASNINLETIPDIDDIITIDVGDMSTEAGSSKRDRPRPLSKKVSSSVLVPCVKIGLSEMRTAEAAAEEADVLAVRGGPNRPALILPASLASPPEGVLDGIQVHQQEQPPPEH